METILPSKHELIQDSERNEENIPSSKVQQNKDKLCKEPNEAHKNTVKEESCKQSLRIS
jgi:hypothetical protein